MHHSITVNAFVLNVFNKNMSQTVIACDGHDCCERRRSLIHSLILPEPALIA